MVREYIGARYVPKFMGTYDNTQVYEALCVVDNGLGTSYISKIPTPAGTPLTDTDYWAVYGASSGAIINLQNQIDDMNDGSVVGSLQNQINDVNTDLGAVQAALNPIVNPRFIFCGDSYDNITTVSWIDTVISRLGLSNSIKCAVGGYGFCPTTKQWITLVQNATIDDDDTITDICIGGGVNDSFYLANIAADMASFDAYVRGRFTNLKHIYVAYMGANFASKAAYVNSQKAKNAYYKTAKSLGWEVLEGVCNTLYNAQYMQVIGVDKLHPNLNGTTALAENMAQALLRGSCSNAQWNSITMNAGSGFTTQSFYLQEIINDDVIDLHMNDTSLTVGASALTGSVLIASCGDLENSFTGKYINMWVTRSGDEFMGLAFFNDFNDLYLIVPGGKQLPAGAVVTLHGFDQTFTLEQPF